MDIQNEAKAWLKNYAHELAPEELPTEEEKIKAARSLWIYPEKVSGLGEYSLIVNSEKFNEIIGDPKKWQDLVRKRDIFEKWVFPHAVILFGKNWFDKVKWKPNISRGIPFGLFTEEERRCASQQQINLEQFPSAQTKILKIVEKTKYALKTYLKAEWYEKGSVKPPGGYIVEAIKNNLIHFIGRDLGFKLVAVPLCPYCFYKKHGSYKTVLIRHSNNEYACFRCIELAKNIDLRIKKEYDGEVLQVLEDEYWSADNFKKFSATTCVCPNIKCNKLVPLTCVRDVDDEVLKKVFKLSPVKGAKIFREVPLKFRSLMLKCPFCYTNFCPKTITGLPTVSIWQNITESLETKHSKVELSCSNKNFQNEIVARQKLTILKDELILRIDSVKNNKFNDILKRYFYFAAIKWMNLYWKDAAGYFFGGQKRLRKLTEKEKNRYAQQTRMTTDVPRGQEVAIHQSFFNTWMSLLEENIHDFTAVEPFIKTLSDFPWFCRPPRFNGGPRSTFVAEVDSRMRVENKTPICSQREGDFKPRIARLLSFRKDVIGNKESCMEHVRTCEWQAIRLNPNSNLQPGTRMRVEAIIMPGHPTHAPIQRILRLRKKELVGVIEKLQREEETGTSDVDFWKARKNLLKGAKSRIDLTILGEDYARVSSCDNSR